MTTHRNSRRDPQQGIGASRPKCVDDHLRSGHCRTSTCSIWAWSIASPSRMAPRLDVGLASSPGHPGSLLLPKQVADAIRELDSVSECKVKIVNDPPWTLDRISDHARVNMTVVGSLNTPHSVT